MDIVTLEIIIVTVCLFFSAFFSASETAITSLGTLKAKHLLEQKGRKARHLNLWLQHPGRVLTTILIYNNVVNILASAIATDLASTYFESQAIGIATGTMTFLVLIFGEVIPKSFAKVHHEKLAIPILKIISVIYHLSFPLVWALSEFASVVVKKIGADIPESPPITEEELEYLVNVGEKTGVLEGTKKEMIVGIFEFDETKVREIMTPRTDVVMLAKDDEREKVLSMVLEKGYSRIPVYGDSIDNIIGILLAKDLIKLAQASSNGSFQLDAIIREPFFVPETKLIIDVFKDLKRTKNHIAVVIDEHGGTAGLVTMEDILEEIVGEIQDEYDTEEADILELEQGVYDVAGSTNISNLLEFFQIEQSEFREEEIAEDADTIAGWIVNVMGEVPKQGETCKLGPLNVEITEVQRQRIQRLRISIAED